MHDRSLQEVRRKFVHLLRHDPPPPAALAPTRLAHVPDFDRWFAARFSSEEVQAVFRLEREYGEQALAEWFQEVALEAGIGSSAAN